MAWPARTRRALTMGGRMMGASQACAWWGASPAGCVAGREGKAKQRLCPCSLLALSCLGRAVAGASVLRMEPCKGGQRCWMQGSSLLLLVQALTWHHLPSLLGQRSPCKSYSAISGKICFSLILPGSAWLAGLISLK